MANAGVATITAQDLLHMSASHLRKWLEDHKVTVPRRQSKDFLRSVALSTHAKLEAEVRATDRPQRVMRRRPLQKREAPTYTSASNRRKLARSAVNRSSSITTRSRAAFLANESSPIDDSAGSDVATGEENLSRANSNSKDTKENRSMQHAVTNDDAAHQKTENGDESCAVRKTDRGKSSTREINYNSKKGLLRHAAAEVEKKESTKAVHVVAASVKARSRKAETHHVSRIQRLKRSGDVVLSQVSERVMKRLKMAVAAPAIAAGLGLAARRPSRQLRRSASLLLAMCAIIGVASYLYHLKKLEEEKARSRRWWW